MKIPLIGIAAVALVAAILIAIKPPAAAGQRDFAFTSTTIDLPTDDQRFPGGPAADVVNDNCTACHSASMTLNQPALSADQWKATVTKMREVYKAPIADADVPAILSYLNDMSAGQASAGRKGRSGD